MTPDEELDLIEMKAMIAKRIAEAVLIALVPIEKDMKKLVNTHVKKYPD